MFFVMFTVKADGPEKVNVKHHYIRTVRIYTNTNNDTSYGY